MSLPFADNPDKSSIYNDLKVEKLVDLEASDFDAFKARMDAQGVDGLEDEYRRLLLLGLASDKLSVSGPIPGSGQILNFTASTAGDNVDLFIAPKGQVWSVIGASYIVNGISGTVTHLLYLNGNYTGAGGGSVVISEKPSTDAGDNFGDVDFSPLHLDNNMKLRYTFYGTATSVSVRLALIRIR